MKYFVDKKGQQIVVDLPSGDVTEAVVDGERVAVDLKATSEKGVVSCIIDNVPYLLDLVPTDDGYRVHANGVDLDVTVADERAMSIRKLVGSSTKKRDSAGAIKAPMPGLVVKLMVSEGDVVAKGQGVIVVEAMKMENEIATPVDGTVKAIKVVAGQAVNKSDLMIVIVGNGE